MSVMIFALLVFSSFFCSSYLSLSFSLLSFEYFSYILIYLFTFPTLLSFFIAFLFVLYNLPCLWLIKSHSLLLRKKTSTTNIITALHMIRTHLFISIKLFSHVDVKPPVRCCCCLVQQLGFKANFSKSYFEDFRVQNFFL